MGSGLESGSPTDTVWLIMVLGIDPVDGLID